MFRSPSDRKQVDILADRIFVKHRPKFMDVYERETEKAYGYVLIDNQPGTVKERQVVCEILGNCHAYPNIIQSSVQTMQPTKELSTKVSIKSPQVTISRKPPCKRPRVSQEWTALEETYTSEGEYESESSEGEYESENSEGEPSESSEGDLEDSDWDIEPPIFPRQGSGRLGVFHSN